MIMKYVISIIFYGTVGLMTVLTLITALSMWHNGQYVPPGLILTGVLLTMLLIAGKVLLTPREEVREKDI